VGARYVVSVRHGASLSYADVRTRCEARPQLLAKGPGFVLHAIMDFVVDQYFPIVDSLEDDLEALEADIFGEAVSRDTTVRIYTLKRDLLEIKRGVSPLVDICNRLMRTDLDLIPDDARPRRLRPRDPPEREGGRGIYGMNFEFMPELRWRWGYPVVMTVTVCLCGMLYYRFKRSGWL
jgi:magnesium transporter